MDFNLTGEQELLRDGLTKFLAARYDLAESRSAAKTGAGWQPEIWRAFAEELGILGATFPEDIGGIGGGPTELMVIAEALGHALVIEPYVGTVVLAGGLLARANTEAAHALLERIAAQKAQLSKSERKVADCVLAQPEAAINDTIAALAAPSPGIGHGPLASPRSTVTRERGPRKRARTPFTCGSSATCA